jgi:hypothetical protein
MYIFSRLAGKRAGRSMLPELKSRVEFIKARQGRTLMGLIFLTVSSQRYIHGRY